MTTKKEETYKHRIIKMPRPERVFSSDTMLDLLRSEMSDQEVYTFLIARQNSTPYPETEKYWKDCIKSLNAKTTAPWLPL